MGVLAARRALFSMANSAIPLGPQVLRDLRGPGLLRTYVGGLRGLVSANGRQVGHGKVTVIRGVCTFGARPLRPPRILPLVSAGAARVGGAFANRSAESRNAPVREPRSGPSTAAFCSSAIGFAGQGRHSVREAVKASLKYQVRFGRAPRRQTDRAWHGPHRRPVAPESIGTPPPVRHRRAKRRRRAQLRVHLRGDGAQ